MGAARRSAAVTALVLAGLAVSPPAWALTPATVELPVAASGWSWAAPAGLPIPGSPATPEGDLAVGYAGDPDGRPSARSYLALDLSALPAEATVVALPLVLPLDPDAANVQPADQSLRACLPAGDWTAGPGTDASKQPADDCAVSAPGRFDAASSSYRFDLAGFADAWAALGSGRGVVIVPSAASSSPQSAPFQLAFLASGVRAQAEVQLAAAEPPQQPAVDVETPAQVDTGSTGSTGGSGYPFVPSSGLPAAPTPRIPAPVAAPAPVAPAAAAPALSVASRAQITAALAQDNPIPVGLALATGLGLVTLALVSQAAGDRRPQLVIARAAARRRATAAALAADPGAAAHAAPVPALRVSAVSSRQPAVG